MAVGQFRSYIWDPLLIISQIIAVQSIFYLCLGAWLFCIYSFAGQQVLVQHLFDPTVCVTYVLTYFDNHIFFIYLQKS